MGVGGGRGGPGGGPVVDWVHGGVRRCGISVVVVFGGLAKKGGILGVGEKGPKKGCFWGFWGFWGLNGLEAVLVGI